MEKELLYELILVDEEDGVFANSFVDTPAIERDFVFFGKEINFQSVSDEKRLVAGPLLIPNKKILRLQGDGTPYYVFFKPETIDTISRKFMKNKYNSEVTVDHDKKVSGVYLTESWIIEESSKDKSNIYGYTLPKGTWFGIYKVENEDVWKKVKNGTFRGFSIEGLFEHKVSTIKLSMEKSIDELTEDEAELFLSEIKALIKKDKRYKSKERIEMESINDYPDAVSNNAQKGIDYNILNGNKCATPVGKIRAQQLAQRKNISIDTVRRMYSYLSRAETYYTEAQNRSDCGYISFMLWGGLSGKRWAESKLRELGVLREGKDVAEALETQPSISSTYPGEVAKKKKDESK